MKYLTKQLTLSKLSTKELIEERQRLREIMKDLKDEAHAISRYWDDIKLELKINLTLHELDAKEIELMRTRSSNPLSNKELAALDLQ